MSPANDLWTRQFVEEAKEIARLYDLFDTTRDLIPFDQARELWEGLNDRYNLSLDLLDYVKLGRSLLGKHDLPSN